MRTNKNAATVTIICIVALILTSLLAAHYVKAADTDNVDCTDCHVRNMERHRFPTGSCTTCHNIDMSTLRIRDGKTIPMEQSSMLCNQCHADIYQAWKDGEHGLVSSNCVECHDPHTRNESPVSLGPKSPLLPLALQALAAAGVLIGASLTAAVTVTRLREK